MSVKDKPFEWRCLAEQKKLKMHFLISAVYFHYLPNSSIETTIVQWCNQCLCSQQLLQSKRFRRPIQENRCGLQLKFPNRCCLEEFSIKSPFKSFFLKDLLNKVYFGCFNIFFQFVFFFSIIEACIRFSTWTIQCQSSKMFFSRVEAN